MKLGLYNLKRALCEFLEPAFCFHVHYGGYSLDGETVSKECCSWRKRSNLVSKGIFRLIQRLWKVKYPSQQIFTCAKSTIEIAERKCKICSKLTIKTTEWHQWLWSGVFIVNFEHISHLFLVYLLLISSMYLFGG